MSAFVASIALDGGTREAGAARLNQALLHGAEFHAHEAGPFHCRTAATPGYWQPAIETAGDGLVLVGMVRLDRRDQVAALLPRDRSSPPVRSDAALLLDAYRRWGGAMLEQVSGDFSFVIWNAAQRRLIAATDQFAARPLFYAQAGGCLLLSDSLDALRAMDGVDRALDETFLAETICIGFGLDPAATIYADIRRLPPAHRLSLVDGAIRIERYWQLPRRAPTLFHRRAGDYAEQFREVFLRAVADRLPATAPIGVLMSGGLDSTSVAAAARHLLGADEAAARITAYTVVMRDFVEEEGRFATMVTDRLGIGARHLVSENFSHRPIPAQPWLLPEPGLLPDLSPASAAGREIATRGGVMLGGIGGDALLAPFDAGIVGLLRAEGWRTPLTVARHLSQFARLPLAGTRRAWRDLLRKAPITRPPPWINPEFARRTALADRLAAYSRTETSGTASMSGAFWTRTLQMGIASASGTCESGHPFFDVQLAELAIRLPEAQLRNKRVLRDAMAPLLPREVVERPKTPLGQATLAVLRDPVVQARYSVLLDRIGAWERYFDVAALRRAAREPEAWTAFALSRTEATATWLDARG